MHSFKQNNLLLEASKIVHEKSANLERLPLLGSMVMQSAGESLKSKLENLIALEAKNFGIK